MPIAWYMKVYMRTNMKYKKKKKKKKTRRRAGTHRNYNSTTATYGMRKRAFGAYENTKIFRSTIKANQSDKSYNVLYGLMRR